MNKLTEVQKQKLDDLAKTVKDLTQLNIANDTQPAIGAVWQAGQDFRDSLPFSIMDEQLEYWWNDGSSSEDAWNPKTLLEDDLLILLRNVNFLNECSTIYQFADSLQNVEILIERTFSTSDEEYPGL